MSEENKKPEENKAEESKTPEVKKEETPKAEAAEKKEEPKAETKEEPKAAAGEEKKSKPIVEKAPTKPEAKEDKGPRGEGAKGKGPRGKGKGSKRRSRHEQQEQSEYTEKVVQVRRVTKVCKGGKKLSFRTTVIIGNEKGKVGVGVGKAAEVLVAIKKAIADARKKVVDISTVPNTNTISHTVMGIAGGSKVMLKPAADGTGIIAGGTARIVLELAGVGDILSKSQGSKSPLNVARATVNALKQLRSFQEVASLRGTSVKKMLFA